MEIVVANDAVEHTGRKGSGLEHLSEKVHLLQEGSISGVPLGGRGLDMAAVPFPTPSMGAPAEVGPCRVSQQYKREEGKKNNSRAGVQVDATRQIEQRAITRP